MSVAELSVPPIILSATLRTVICGSFRRNPAGLRAERDELIASGCEILSPLELDFADEQDGFVFLEHELGSEPTEIERKHVEAIRDADFVWLHAPDGYVGPSGAFEFGVAHAAGVPVFVGHELTDVGLRDFVSVAPSPASAAQTRRSGTARPGEPLRALQTYYGRVAKLRGWSGENAVECMLLLTEEIGELARSVRQLAGLDRHGRGASDESAAELADVQLYLVHLANTLGVDLAWAVTRKEEVNTQRFLLASRRG